MSEPLASGGEPLSVDQAIASLVAEPEATEETNEAPEAPVEAAEEPTETQGETSAPEEPEGEAENPAEETEEPAEPEPEPLEPPLYWKPEGKAKWSEVPREVQAEILAQEGPREAAAAKAKAEAAQQVEAAQKEVQGVRTLAEQLGKFLPEAIKTFQSNWGEQEPNWGEISDQYGADQAFKLKAQYDAQQKQLAQVAQAAQQAQQEAHKAFVQAEWKELAALAPDLAPDVSDPTKGTDKRQAVVKYLTDYGIPKEAVTNISAREMTLAHKAMLWDQSQALLKAKPPSKPAAPPAKPSAKPSAVQTQTSSERSASAVANRFAQTRSVDDAVALLLARGK